MPIALHDTLTRSPRVLTAPSGDRKFRLYCCGPTVYARAHIGNFRTFLLQDVLVRLLRLEFGPQAVLHVRNLTDVDDRTIAQANREKRPLRQITEYWTQLFHDDARTLNLLVPEVEPRATDHIAEQIDLIERLVAKGHAYIGGDGSVYYRIASFPTYGRLSHVQQRDLATQAENSAGATNLADDYSRETVADFALWKLRKPEDGDVFWPSPWGEGRPGWHIECSAMSRKYLGDSFDLHGGGVDLTFPHHENEIAQSEAATGVTPFCRHWFHSAHLLVEGQKMSKSLGNSWTLDDVLKAGHSPMALRYMLISASYHQPLNCTHEGLKAAATALGRIERAATLLWQRAGQVGLPTPATWAAWLGDVTTAPEGPLAPAFDALRDDLNTSGAFGALFTVVKPAEWATLEATAATDLARSLGRLLYALGLDLFTTPAEAAPTAPAEVQELAAARWAAKQARQFAEADRLRQAIAAAGWTVKDRKDGYDLAKA